MSALLTHPFVDATGLGVAAVAGGHGAGTEGTGTPEGSMVLGGNAPHALPPEPLRRERRRRRGHRRKKVHNVPHWEQKSVPWVATWNEKGRVLLLGPQWILKICMGVEYDRGPMGPPFVLPIRTSNPNPHGVGPHRRHEEASKKVRSKRVQYYLAEFVCVCGPAVCWEGIFA